MGTPKNWPASFPYIKSPLHSKELTKQQIEALRTRQTGASSVAPNFTTTPSNNVKIQAITDASHPANGQFGLFAAQNIKPGSFILAYLGRVHSGEAASAESDYDLWLDRDADVAVDAAKEGNEGRFVNDYRGIGKRANAEFSPVWCERWGEMCVGIWAIGSGKKEVGGIKKGEEILVSYGKGFWDERRKEMEEEKGAEA